MSDATNHDCPVCGLPQAIHDMEERDATYWLSSDNGETWREVDRASWVHAERAAGFVNTMGHPELPGTGGFSSTSSPTRGEVRYRKPAEEEPKPVTVTPPEGRTVTVVMPAPVGMGKSARERNTDLLFFMRALNNAQLFPGHHVYLDDGTEVFFDSYGDDMGNHEGHDHALSFKEPS